MKIRYQIVTAFVLFLLLAGMSARAGKMRLSAQKQASDTAKAKQSEPKIPESSIVDEVIWIVGDEPILKSEVEAMRLEGESQNMKWNGDPDCAIPEQMAVQKLFLHQAQIDSIEVTESEISQGIEDQINHWISMFGSREKLEEYRNMSVTQMRQQMHDDFKNSQLIQRMKQKLVKDIEVTPSAVRKYFDKLPEDSIPFVPTAVEVEILTNQAKISQQEINRVKEELRNYTERINSGETTFATLARLYSEDPGSARMGGEMDYAGRAKFVPEFAAVAFNLTDPKKVSKIVETEFGFHIIQLIDKRGDRVKVRHILRKPHVSQEAVDAAILHLDSIAADIRANKFSFEEAASFLSDDKDTKSNNGLMAYNDPETMSRTSRFQMKDLPTEVARVVDTMKVGEVSRAFRMINEKGKTVCALVKLKSRIEGHRANITEDFQVMQNAVLEKERQKKLHDWVVNKIRNTYVRMNDRYKDCKFEYQGWVK
ncbi:MAG: peptidylprolyl isomerase [Prevotella sp.]|nr:peptidylprolyl isomerase [Prevotella sp.]